MTNLNDGTPSFETPKPLKLQNQLISLAFLWMSVFITIPYYLLPRIKYDILYIKIEIIIIYGYFVFCFVF